MDIKLKRNKTYIISVDYRHHTILSCYADDKLLFKIDLSNSLVKINLCDYCAIITVFKRSQKHKLNDECYLIIDNESEYLEFPSGSRDTTNILSFIDFINIIQSYNNIKEYTL